MVSAIVLQDIEKALGTMLDKVIISKLHCDGIAVDFVYRGLKFRAKFIGNGKIHTIRLEDAVLLVYDSCSGKNYLEEIEKNFF